MADAVNSSVVQSLAWTLLHFVWQGAAIWGLAWIAMRLAPASASRRYGIGVAALALMGAAPVVTFLILSAGPAAVGSNGPGPSEAVSLVAAADVALSPAAHGTAPASGLLPPWAFAAMVGVWIVGMTVFALRLVGGWVVARRLARRAVRPVAAHVQRLVLRITERLALQRSVVVLESSALAVPILVGWIRPVIVLPVAALTGLSPVQIEALLAHELAHVRRHDYLVNVLQSMVEVVLFYHPAVWWTSRRVRRERELCCDDLAVGICDRLVYATALSDLAALAGPRLALAATDGDLLARVRRVLGRDQDQAPAPTRWTPVILLAIAGAAIVPVSIAWSAEPAAQGASPVGQVAPVEARVVSAAEAVPEEPAVAPGVGQGTDPQTSAEELRARLLETERALVAAEKAQQAELEMARRRVEDARAKFNAGLLSSSELMEIELEMARVQARGDARTERAAELAALERHMKDLQVMVEIGTASALDVAKLQGDIAHLESLQQDSSGLLAARAALESARVQLARTRELFEKGLVSQSQLQSAELRIREAEHQLADAEARVGAQAREEDRVRQATREADANRQALLERYKALQRLYIEEQGAERRSVVVPRTAPVDPAQLVTVGDVLSIKIAGEPDLPPTYVVKEDGTIRILFLGAFKVVGQTAAQVRDAIGKALADRRLGSASQVTVTARRAIRRTAIKR